MTGESRYQPVKSADRTLEVLEALAAATGPLGLVELTRQLGIPKSSLHAILRTLSTRGWAETDQTGTRFRLGIRALQVGAAYVDTDDSVELLRATLDDLASEFGETVHLGRLIGPDVIYLAKRESIHPLRLFSAVGRRLPAHATALGKALLAHDDDATLRGRLAGPLAPMTAATLTSRRALRAELRDTRARGYAVDREENTIGIFCVAVAVPRFGPVIDAVSISTPTARVRPETESNLASALQRSIAAFGRL